MPQPAKSLQFRGLRSPVEVFFAGTHTDKNGNSRTFTVDELDQMVANVSGHGVPSVIGHPKETDPAYAWSKLRREGDSLYADFADIAPSFEAAVDGGAYRERSLSVFQHPEKGWVVQHIGWLGAVPPALALKPLEYSAPAGAQAEGALSFEFASPDTEDLATGWALGDVARLLRGLRDWLISDKGLDTADKVLPDYAITSVADAGRRITDAAMQEAANPSNYAAAPAGAHDMPITQADLEQARKEAAAAAVAEQAAQFAAQGQELAELRAQRVNERIGVQINDWKAKGLLLPAEEPGLAQFMAALEAGAATEFAFSAGTQQVKQTPAAWFAAFMGGRKAIKLGERDDDPPPDDAVDVSNAAALGEAARQFMADQAKKGIVISAAQAVQHLQSKHGG